MARKEWLSDKTKCDHFLRREAPANKQHLPDRAGHGKEDGGTGLRYLAQSAVERRELSFVVSVVNVEEWQYGGTKANGHPIDSCHKKLGKGGESKHKSLQPVRQLDSRLFSSFMSIKTELSKVDPLTKHSSHARHQESSQARCSSNIAECVH